MSFEDIHSIATEFFHSRVPNERSVTHHVVTDKTNFLLYYNNDDHVDFFHKKSQWSVSGLSLTGLNLKSFK